MVARKIRGPLRAVVEADRATTITNNGYGRQGEHDDWTLRLECGHLEYRYARPEAIEAPKSARCARCRHTE